MAKKKKLGKIQKLLLSIPEEKNNLLGLEVERLIKNEMKYIVNMYILRFTKATFETFGWDRDDLLQHVRVILWKGIATFDPKKNIKVETYLSSCLYYQFLNLSKKCKRFKYSLSKLYCPEVLFESDENIEHETAEDWYRYVQSFSAILNQLNELERKVLARYFNNENLALIGKSVGLKRVEVISILKDIREQMQEDLQS